MEINKNYFLMCQKTPIPFKKIEDIKIGDYFINSEVDVSQEIIKPLLYVGQEVGKNILIIPTLEQLLGILPLYQFKSRIALQFLQSNSFFIKEKDYSYDTILEHFYAQWMYFTNEMLWDGTKKKWNEKVKFINTNE